MEVNTMTATAESIIVGMGEMRVSKIQSAVLACLGLGSCIALCAYDPVAKVGGIAHMVLPTSGDGDNKKISAHYVDTGVPLLIREMGKQGAAKSRLIVKVIGGARMFSIPGSCGNLDIGERNITELKSVLAKEGISVVASDIRGNHGRTLHLFMDSGTLMVKKAGGEFNEL